jgi:hypothetical protein
MLDLRPGPGEYAEYYETYVRAAGDGDPMTGLETQRRAWVDAVRGLSDAQASFRYAPGKWTIREVLSHVIDAERVFTYRALRFARGDETPLPGFDQEQWQRWTNADSRPLDDLVEEFGHVRGASISLFRGLPAEAFTRRGVASGYPFSVRAILHVTLGHGAHHLAILQERYLSHPEFPR